MQSILNSPTLKEHHETYQEGQSIFVEGDDSKDLFILVHGSLKLLKNKKQIGEIYKSGELLGEMSYLLDTKRTASVVAQTEAQVIRIPEDNIFDFLNDHPEVSQRIINTLALRLKDTTQVAHGLKEFCDQLPDAVVMTNTQNKIIAWNKMAETLHGRVWQEMKGQLVSEVFQNPEEYRQFIEDVSSGKHLKEKILLIKHPDGEKRYVSTSTTIIYDGHFNIAGYIFLSRNVTKLKQLEAKYQRIKRLFIPSFAIIAVLLMLILAGLSNFSAGIKILDHKKKSFKSRILHDYSALKTSLTPFTTIEDTAAINSFLENYFNTSHPEQFAISGALLLNSVKEVIGAHCPSQADQGRSLIGTNYSGIEFSGEEDDFLKILNLYRTNNKNPMGKKGTEIAMAVHDKKGTLTSWIVFQIETGYLDREFGITTKILPKLQFETE